MVGCFLICLVMLMLVLIRLVVVVVDDDYGSAVVYMLDLGPKGNVT